MTLLDKLIILFTSCGFEQTTTDMGYICMAPRTVYSPSTIWLGPTGNVRSGATVADSVSLDDAVNWSAVVGYEAGRRDDARNVPSN